MSATWLDHGVDQHGRMLAYLKANYSDAARKQIPVAQHPTFNLQMMQEGYAVSLLIYPNVPKPSDLKLVQNAVCTARQNALGFWSESEKSVAPYEFRWLDNTLVETRQRPDRCCGDLVSGESFVLQQYYRVLQY